MSNTTIETACDTTTGTSRGTVGDTASDTAGEEYLEFLASLPDGPIRDLYVGAIVGPDPYPVYARLRDAGVIITASEAHISRYADVRAVLRHSQVSTDARNSTAFGLLDQGLKRSLDTARSRTPTHPTTPACAGW